MALDLKEMYDQLSGALNDIDEKLDSRDGGTGSIKSKVINDAVEATKANWEKVSGSIVDQLSSSPEDIQIGFYYGLARALDKQFGETAKKYVDAKVETMPKPEPLIAEADVPAITEQRKEVYAQIKAVMNMAETFGDDSFKEMEPPRRRGGAPKGKRGPRAISYVRWAIEDQEFESLKDVIDVVPQYEKVRDIIADMKKAKINTTQPPARIEFTLPNGKTLIGVNTAVDDDDDDDDDENETTDTDNDSATE